MNEKIISELKNAYNIKPSEKKNQFIQNYKQYDMSIFEFIILQTKYLHSFFSIRCVLLSLVLIFVCLFSTSSDTLMIVSALIPFIVLIMMYEVDASRIFKMEEIEQATKFSLKMIVFARLLIVGFISMLCLIVLTLITINSKQIPIYQIIISFFVPYFLTVLLCLIILRTNRENGMKYSFIITVIVSLMFVTLRTLPELSYVIYKTNVGLIFLTICIGLCVIESKKFVMNFKEVLWN